MELDNQSNGEKKRKKEMLDSIRIFRYPGFGGLGFLGF
jgi:hypothetical protein